MRERDRRHRRQRDVRDDRAVHQRAQPERDGVGVAQRREVALRVHVEGGRFADAFEDALGGVGQGGDDERRGLPEGDEGLVRGGVGVGQEDQDGRDGVAEEGGGQDGGCDGGRDGAPDGAGGERARGRPDADEEVEGRDDADALDLEGEAEEEGAVLELGWSV